MNGGATTAEGTAAINALRARAHASQRAGYSLSDICDEWSREFYLKAFADPPSSVSDASVVTTTTTGVIRAV